MRMLDTVIVRRRPLHHCHRRNPNTDEQICKTAIISVSCTLKILLAGSMMHTGEGLGLGAQVLDVRRHSIPVCAARRQRGDLRGAEPAGEVPGGAQPRGVLLPLQLQQRLHSAVRAFDPTV